MVHFGVEDDEVKATHMEHTSLHSASDIRASSMGMTSFLPYNSVPYYDYENEELQIDFRTCKLKSCVLQSVMLLL